MRFDLVVKFISYFFKILPQKRPIYIYFAYLFIFWFISKARHLAGFLIVDKCFFVLTILLNFCIFCLCVIYCNLFTCLYMSIAKLETLLS